MFTEVHVHTLFFERAGVKVAAMSDAESPRMRPALFRLGKRVS
jgi:hypothetical protein